MTILSLPIKAKRKILDNTAEPIKTGLGPKISDRNPPATLPMLPAMKSTERRVA